MCLSARAPISSCESPRCNLTAFKNGYSTSPRRKTRAPPGRRPASEMALARRSARLRVMRSHDHRPATGSKARTRRDAFDSLPDGRMPFGPQRLVLSGQRLFETRPPPHQRSIHLERLRSAIASPSSDRRAPSRCRAKYLRDGRYRERQDRQPAAIDLKSG